ncbi:unnamed protein product [Haemonchus placei]|uniref:Reverse transcriptase domain-containing protein n=1 Tax=Haemonchus placei TaxID=6290 RepID=A0A0N4VXD9_HAEPC|nr:unnamed protein product [Haemonchus placei]
MQAYFRTRSSFEFLLGTKLHPTCGAPLRAATSFLLLQMMLEKALNSFVPRTTVSFFG